MTSNKKGQNKKQSKKDGVKQHSKIIKEKHKAKDVHNLKKKLKSAPVSTLVADIVSITKDKPKPALPKELSTISIAIPGTILENAQTDELRTYLVGQIARAAAIFQVDEIIVYDDFCNTAARKTAQAEVNGTMTSIRLSCVQMGRILQFVECPPYLRRSIFPRHKDLQFCGLINPLNSPHHLAKDDYFPYREGVVVSDPSKAGHASMVNIGLTHPVAVDKFLTAGVRCTVELPSRKECKDRKRIRGTVVSPLKPRLATGAYWGYTVRLASSLSQVLTQCPYSGGYDLTIGTSDKGTPIDQLENSQFNFHHLLIVFGGVDGIESALECDQQLKVEHPKFLFDYYINSIPNQGTKTIRTQEAVLITLTSLRSKWEPKHAFNVMQTYNTTDC